jgi:hypothetical protein
VPSQSAVARERCRNACGWAAAGFPGDLLRTQIGHADRAQELLLATDLGLMQRLRSRDSLPVGLDLRFQLGLPGCFASRYTLREEFVLVGVVVGAPAPAVARLAVRPTPARLD